MTPEGLPSVSSDYFQFFGLERRLQIDVEDLQRRFYTLSRKLHPDRPSWTLTAHLCRDTYSHIHYDPDQARTISVREAARLQSFPDGFVFSGTMNSSFRQIGNAVPPLIARAIALRVLEALSSRNDVPQSVQRRDLVSAAA